MLADENRADLKIVCDGFSEELFGIGLLGGR